MIHGITVELAVVTDTGIDPFGNPVRQEEWVSVENVLVAPASSADITTTTDLVGRKAVYTLGIPKGDTHHWENRKVRFFGQTFRTFGFSTEGIDENIPLCWNKKIQVEKYG